MRRFNNYEKWFLLWRELLDLGVNMALAYLMKGKNKKEALNILRQRLNSQSEEHWQGICRILKDLK